MNKYCFLLICPILLASCQMNKKLSSQNLSVTQDDESIVSQWFGPDHFKDENDDKNLAQDAVQAQAPPPALITPGGLIYQVDSEPLPNANSAAPIPQSNPYRTPPMSQSCNCPEEE